MLSPMERVNKYYEGLKKGSIDSLEPLLPLFTMEGNPLSLEGREPTIPIFKLQRPKRMTLLAGRQVSKSYTLAELAILMTGLSPGFHTAIIEPRHIQKKRLNSQIIAPLLRDCLVRDLLIDKKHVDTLDLKTFKSGGQLLLINGFLTPDAARGASGASMVQIDECLHERETILTFDFEHKKWKIKKISEICAKDVLTSFKNNAILYSVAVRDASYRGVRSCYRVSTASGRTITCTSGHRLPTNLGKLRLEEVVDYVSELSDGGCKSRFAVRDGGNCDEGWFYRGAGKCNSRDIIGGRLYSLSQGGEKEHLRQVEPLMETVGVCFPQVPDITRVLYTRTCEERESRIRGLLGSINNKELRNIQLVVASDVRRERESNYPHIPVADNPSCSFGVVVHGRRIETDRSEHREHSNKRVLLRGSGLTQSVAEGSLGADCECNRGEAQLNREEGLCSSSSEERLCETLRDDRALCPGLHEVQDRGSDASVRAVRENYAEGTQPLLLTCLCSGIKENKTSRISGEDERPQKREVQTVEGCKSGESQGDGSCSLCEDDTRAEGEVVRAPATLQGEAQGRDKCSEKGEKITSEGRSEIQGTESCGRQGLQRTTEAGSGEICSLSTEETGVREDTQRGSRSTSEDDGAAKSSKSSCECRSGEESCAISTRQSERQAPFGEHDSGRARKVQGEESCAEEGTVLADEGGSGEVGCTKRERFSEVQGEVRAEDTRGKGQDQRQTQGTQTTESRTRGSSVRSLAEEGSGDPAGTLLIEPIQSDFFYDPIVSIEYVGEDAVYDIEVEGTHNYILSNGICSYNCQDIPNAFIPIFEAITDAKVETGFRIRSGTAKTSDGTLAISFDESSQGHWCIKCSCGKYNIAALDEQLLQMVGDKGCSCAWCRKPLNVVEGYYLHKYPSRIYSHVGYHMPQIIFPFHNTKGGWTEILHKKANNSQTAFLNEVLGAPDDESVRLLSKSDLLKARNNVRSKDRAVELIHNYDMRVLGVDWGGGGGGDSATGLAIIAKNYNARHYECLWMTRLPQGLTPEQEADIVARMANEFKADFIAHDYTGAGFVRESLFLQKHEGWRDYMYPISYTYKPTADLVTPSSSGSRNSYTVDKTKSLLLTINCIKHGALSLPWFDEKDINACQLDFLAIIEHQQKIGEGDAGGKNNVLRASDVYLLDKVAGKKDDAAQAVNVGLIAACNILGYYPVFTFDEKYNMTAEQYELLTGDSV